MVWQRCVGATTDEANVAEILPTVSFESFDLRFIVGGIRGPADAGKEPFRVVLRRAGKSLGDGGMV